MQMSNLIQELQTAGFEFHEDFKRDDITVMTATDCTVWLTPLDEGTIRIAIMLPDGGVVRFTNVPLSSAHSGN